MPICQQFPAVTLLQPAAMKKSFVRALNAQLGDSAFAEKPLRVISNPRKFPVPFTLKLSPPLLNVLHGHVARVGDGARAGILTQKFLAYEDRSYTCWSQRMSSVLVSCSANVLPAVFRNGGERAKEPTGFRRYEEVTIGWCLRFSGAARFFTR